MKTVPIHRGGVGRGTVAFTIIEIMLAIAIFSMVITAIYSSWSAILRASKVGAEAAAEVQRSRIAARTFQDGLSCAVLFGANPLLYAFEANTSSDFADLSFVARLPPSFPGSGFFGDQVVRRVRFSVESGQDGINKLVLTQLPLLQTNREDLVDYSIVLAREVSLFALEFCEGPGKPWTDEWVRTNQLPKLVRFALAFGQGAPPGRAVEVTTRTVYVASTAVAQEVQAPRALPGAPGVGPPGGPPVLPPGQGPRLQPPRPPGGGLPK